MRVEKIALDKIRISENRNYAGQGDIKILAESMDRNGQIHRITVKPINENDCIYDHDIVAGRRRVRAAKLLGWKEIDAEILEGDEIGRAEEIAGAENINRLGMHPLDEALVFKKLLESGDTIESLAKRFDRKVSEIWQRVQLLDLHDGIKELFREGKISLPDAAMLKSLDNDQQQVFYNKFHESDRISTWDVKGFISKIRHDKLYPCIYGKDCAKCNKRTFYNDKSLFPDLSSTDDLCLDHDCYIGKWQKLLAERIAKIKADKKSHAEANIIACDDDELFKILGKTLVLDKIEYAVVKITWDNRPDDEPRKTSKPCFQIDIEPEEYDDDGNEIETRDLLCVPLYWKEPAKKKEQKDAQPRQNPFVPAVTLLEMPEEEAKQTITALMKKCNPKEPWTVNSAASDIERKVKNRVLDRLLDAIAKKPANESDVDRFLNYFLEKSTERSAVKKFAGSEKISDIKKLSMPKLFAALYATTLNAWRLPDFDKLSVSAKNEVTTWAGITANQLKEMYKEELKAVLPKPAAPKKETEAKPAQGKKPARKKLPSAEHIAAANAAKGKKK